MALMKSRSENMPTGFIQRSSTTKAPMRCSASLRTASSTMSVGCILTTLWPLVRKTSAMSMAASCKLLIRARRFNTALVGSDSLPFAALAKREGVSPSYFTRVVRLSYLAPDIALAILDGRQPRDLTADKLLTHSRLPLTWDEQRRVLGFA